MEQVVYGDVVGDGSDWPAALAQLRDGENIEAHWRQALHLCRYHAPQIRYIADRLLARGRLSGPELDALYDAVTGPSGGDIQNIAYSSIGTPGAGRATYIPRKQRALRSAGRGVARGGSGELQKPPIKLTDDELSAVLRAARPIAVDRRDAFLQQVAAALAGCTEIGPGTVHRAIAAAQRQFFDPPQLGDEDGGRTRRRTVSSKYG